MKGSENLGKRCFVFSSGSCICSFRLSEEGDDICLTGEEKAEGVVIFSQTLKFSAQQAERVGDFAASLSESETFPRMMMELAEDFFS